MMIHIRFRRGCPAGTAVLAFMFARLRFDALAHASVGEGLLVGHSWANSTGR